jgi:transcriptional regulator with XRE-family HTH domain
MIYIKHMHSGDETVFYKEVGSRISDTRKERNISQLDLAKKLNIPQSSLACYETGKRRLPASLLFEIAESLNSDVSAFFPVTGKRKPGPTSRVDTELAKVKVLPAKQQKIIIDLIESVIANTP